MIVYLHGFRSSPYSVKARQLGQALFERGRADEFACPQLPVSPAAAIAMLMPLLAHEPPQTLCLVGSSLGGFYATWLAEKLGCRAILLNPATRPDRDLARHLGRQQVYHCDEFIDVRPEFLDELTALLVFAISRPERYFLIAATGDEVLDWREMVRQYPGALQRIVEGSDHGLDCFPSLIDDVLAFADATEARQSFADARAR